MALSQIEFFLSMIRGITSAKVLKASGLPPWGFRLFGDPGRITGHDDDRGMRQEMSSLTTRNRLTILK